MFLIDTLGSIWLPALIFIICRNSLSNSKSRWRKPLTILGWIVVGVAVVYSAYYFYLLFMLLYSSIFLGLAS